MAFLGKSISCGHEVKCRLIASVNLLNWNVLSWRSIHTSRLYWQWLKTGSTAWHSMLNRTRKSLAQSIDACTLWIHLWEKVEYLCQYPKQFSSRNIFGSFHSSRAFKEFCASRFHKHFRNSRALRISSIKLFTSWNRNICSFPLEIF